MDELTSSERGDLFIHLIWEEEEKETSRDDRPVVFPTESSDGYVRAVLESATAIIATGDTI